MKREWPTREEWAKNRTTCYADLFDDLDLGDFHGLDDSQRDDAIKALQTLWKAEGVRMKHRAEIAGPLCKQPNETGREHTERWLAMTKEEQNLAGHVSECRWNRKEINEAIKAVRNRKWIRWMHSYDGALLPSWMPSDSEAAKIFQPILDRYKAAYKAATEKREQEILSTPIDDDAWAKELEYRARAEYERAHPEIFVRIN
jgi:hypothetical protein